MFRRYLLATALDSRFKDRVLPNKQQLYSASVMWLAGECIEPISTATPTDSQQSSNTDELLVSYADTPSTSYDTNELPQFEQVHWQFYTSRAFYF